MDKKQSETSLGEITDGYHRLASFVPSDLRRRLPYWSRRSLNRLYWLWYDFRDFVAELTGLVPFHNLRLFVYRYVLRMCIGSGTSIHRRCRFYRPAGIQLGRHTVINRDVLLDGRTGVQIGDNVSISEGTAILTLEHDPHSPSFAQRGASVHIGDHVFVGVRALVLPGVTVGKGAVIGAGAVVTRDVDAFAIVAGVPARPIGQRHVNLEYTLDYRKFLG